MRLTVVVTVTVAVIVVAFALLLAGNPARSSRQSGTHQPAGDVARPSSSEGDDEAPANRGAGVSGSVVSTDGSRLAGARVTLWKEDQTDSVFPPKREAHAVASAVTTADGTFWFPRPDGWPIVLEATAKTFSPGRVSVENSESPAMIVLVPGADLEIDVVDPDGTPVASATLKLSPSNQEEARRRGATDEKGRCVFFGVPAGTLFMSVSASGFVPTRRLTTMPPRTTRTVVRLNRGRTLYGRVIDGVTKQPLADANVGFRSDAYPVVKTNEDGRFVFSGFPASADDLYIEGTNSTLGGLDAIKVSAEGYLSGVIGVGDRDSFLVQLRPLPRFGGRVVDRSGAPVSGADILVAVLPEYPSVGGEMFMRTTTDQHGRWETHGGLPRVLHSVFIRKSGFGQVSLDLTPNRLVAGLGDIVLDEGVALDLLLLGDERVRVEGVPVTLELEWTDTAVELAAHSMNPLFRLRRRRSTDPEGRVTFVDLAAGRYRMEMRPPSGPRLRCRFALPRGKCRIRYTVTLVPGDQRSVKEVVLGPNQRPWGHIVELAKDRASVSFGAMDGASSGDVYLVVSGDNVVGELVIQRTHARVSIGRLSAVEGIQIGMIVLPK